MNSNHEIKFNPEDFEFDEDYGRKNEDYGHDEDDELFKNSVFTSCRSWDSMCQIEFDPTFLMDNRLSQNTKIVMAAFYTMPQVKCGGVLSTFIEKCIPSTCDVDKVMDTALEEMKQCGYIEKIHGGWELTYCARNNKPLNF